jgi:hypothetical protein
VKLSSPGRKRDTVGNIEEGKLDTQSFGQEQSERSGAKGSILVEAIRPLDGEPHAYTCETKEGGTFSKFEESEKF